MITLKKINIGKYKFLGVSKEGILHVCYWDKKWGKLVWVPKDEVIDPKTDKLLPARKVI